MPITGIAESPTRQLWDAITALVRANSAFMGAVKYLRMYEGKTTDLDKVSTANMPAVFITPQGGGATWSAERQHDAALIAKVELLVNSTYAGDIFDLWWALTQIIFPGDNSVLDTFGTSYGVYRITMTDPAWGDQTLDDGTRVLYSAGAFHFHQHLNT